MVTTITTIKNHSSVSARVRNLNTGQGYQIAARKVETVALDIPWEGHFGNPNEYLQVSLDDGRSAFITERHGIVKTGPNLSAMGPAQPSANDGGDRDLVIADHGIEIHLAGKSPNMLYGGPARGVSGFAVASAPAGTTEDSGTGYHSLPSGAYDQLRSMQVTYPAPETTAPAADGDPQHVLTRYTDAYAYNGIASQNTRHPMGTIVLLHGYDPFAVVNPQSNPHAKFGQFIATMRHYWDQRGFAVFAPGYDSTKTFVDAASQVGNWLVSGGWPIHRTHYVGYSMGGLVSRVMIAKAVTQPISLSTFCSPHHGTAAWVPNAVGLTAGALSLGQVSMDIHWINNKEPLEKAIRNRTMAIGVYYKDAKQGGYHHNDQLVELKSQMGTGLNFAREVPIQFYEARSPEFIPGIVHGECQHWPTAGAIMGQINSHIDAMEAAFGHQYPH